MRSRTLTIILLLGLCALSASCRKKADAVLIVDDGGVHAKGQVETVFDPNGGYRMNVWVPGNIVLFRVDKEVEVGPGKAENVYLIDQNKKLQAIDSFDLKKTDDELTAMYLKSK